MTMDLSSDFSRIAAPKGQLYQKLLSIRSEMAQAAQEVYDLWHQDETGFDEMYAGGGICHDIASAIVSVIYEHIPNVIAGTVNPSCGENHVWTMIALEQEEKEYDEDGNEYKGFGEGYVVDIPYYVYEKGGGYNWKKISDVEFSPEDITISFVDPDDVRANLEYE
jgi:hypothetical protein